MQSTKSIWTAISVVALIAIIGLFTPAGQQVASNLGFGPQTVLTDLKVTSSFQMGTNGTQLGRVNAGNCTFLSTTTVPANQAATFGCATPGVQPGDGVDLMINIASSTATSTGQWSVVGAQSSSTAGFIVFNLYNSGTVTTIPASIVSAGFTYQVAGATP